jgi:hypothetical protein
VTTFWRVAYREGQTHSTRDHDTEDAAKAHETALRIRPGVSLVIRYQIELLEDNEGSA